MFGIGNLSPDYTFTQSGDRSFTIQSSKAISNYFGNSAVSENNTKKSSTALKKTTDDNNETKVLVSNSDDNSSTESIKKDSKDNETAELHLLGTKEEGSEEDEAFSYGSVSSITSSFSALVQAIGGVGNKVTKTQLIGYLQKLSSEEGTDTVTAQEMSFIKNLIARFDTLSGGSSYITSLDGTKEFQDYTTVTKDQVTSPVDLRV